MADFDLVIKGGRVVIPWSGVVKADIGISGEKIAVIAENISPSAAKETLDASGRHVFPGAVDSHFHIGIYRPMDLDARTESTSAASGGVTTILSYFRTGRNYLNKTGPYKKIFPEVLELSSKSFLVDYGYHITILTEEHISEIEWLVREAGVSTFKYYMFYKLLNLAGSSLEGSSYLMIENPVDLGFLYQYMLEVSRVNELFARYGRISVSVHCENPEIIRVMTREMVERPTGKALEDYSNARPPWQEALAVNETGVIADATGCPVNLLHLSSRAAVDAAIGVAVRYPHLDFLLEGTLHHLGLSNEGDYGRLGKVNPPIRSAEDRDYLWQRLLAGDIDTVVSDHACLTREIKQGDLWTSLPGFGGTSLMFPLLITEGHFKRGLPLTGIAELTSLNPAIRHNLYPKKGTIAIGGDADLAVIDLGSERTVNTEILHSAQDFSPFEGMKYRGWPTDTILRGKLIFKDGKVVGEPGYGRFIKRPVRLHYECA